MKRIKINLSVSDSADRITQLLTDKGFTIFADINHQANAQKVDLTLPAARVLIFGNPVAGTKLMQKDIAMSLDLPLRLAIIEDEGETYIVHHTTEDHCRYYNVEGHPVLAKIEGLFESLASELSAG